ncbi:MAG: HD domain-containing protein [Candidatus Omnitrophica bacterium]|nr:HD domain-containing protein [Candidatus Omnitrophota bacterium]MCM8802600.1 HD domain-containing protein [Candidatus Omnitrophota bacterium]
MKCPGQDPRFLKVEEQVCKNCGYIVEIFSNEIKVSCPRCKADVYRENIPSCIDWCSYARQCIGEEKYKELKSRIETKKEKLDFKEKVLSEMMNYFGDDIKRITHAMKVTYFAEMILKQEPTADSRVVIISAILHDIGIKECERKYNSTDGKLQEKEGPPIAREILQKLGIKKEIIEEVCKIIGSHHSPEEISTLNFKILWDADQIVNIEDGFDLTDKEKLEKSIDKIFMTDTGKQIAKEKFLLNRR